LGDKVHHVNIQMISNKTVTFNAEILNLVIFRICTEAYGGTVEVSLITKMKFKVAGLVKCVRIIIGTEHAL